MRKHLCFLYFLSFSIAAFGFGSNNLNYESRLLNVSPTATPTPVQTKESSVVVLDKKIVCSRLEPGRRAMRNSECVDYNPIVTVSVVESKSKQFVYEYTVSGGRVIGEGAKVIWDLTGAQPGTYEIKIYIGDRSNGEKRTESRTITFIESTPTCGLCECPTLDLSAPVSPLAAGETIVFTANVSGGSAFEFTYHWKVSNGEIIEGQGTPIIRVATDSQTAGKTVKATIEIGGICEECPKTESAEVVVAGKKPDEK